MSDEHDHDFDNKADNDRKRARIIDLIAKSMRQFRVILWVEYGDDLKPAIEERIYFAHGQSVDNAAGHLLFHEYMINDEGDAVLQIRHILHRDSWREVHEILTPKPSKNGLTVN